MSAQLPENVENQLLLRDLVGYAIPVIGTIVSLGIAYRMKESRSVVYDIARDIGIGFFVALVVTIIYEVYARRRYERKRFLSTLELIMNEIIHDQVWKEVRNQIIERSMMRAANHIRLSLEEDDELTNGQMVLCVSYDYDVRSLRSKPVPVRILHYLDNHIECKPSKLPRFEKMEIGGTDYTPEDLKKKIDSGVFSVVRTLKPGERNFIRVRTRRKEIIYVPGSYNLIMGEICEGVEITLNEIPDGIVAFVHVWPHTEKPIRLKKDQTLDAFREKILLPGQGCEFRFTPANIAADRPPLVIISPTAGERVPDDGWVTGTATLPDNAYLWVFLGIPAVSDQWWPQGPNVEVKEDGSWQAHVYYGRRGEMGQFKIAARVVNRKMNRRLAKWYEKAVMSGEYGSINLPEPIKAELGQTVTVGKAKPHLAEIKRINEASADDERRSTERRHKKVAVAKERRLASDRRKAS